MTNYYIKSIINFFNFKKKNPQLWNVDTDYINVIKRLINNLKSNNIKEITKLSTKKTIVDNEERFQLYINDINITPTSNKLDNVARSTMRQYLQFFSSFSWIQFGERQKNWYKKDEYIFRVNISMNKLLFVKNFDDFIQEILIELIITGSISYIKHKKNLSYSFFIYYVFNKKPNLIKNMKLEFQKICKKDDVKYFYSDSPYAQEYLEHKKKEDRSLSNTFYNSFEQIRNIDFENLIKEIYSEIQNRYYGYEEIEEYDYEISQQNIDREDLIIKETFDNIKKLRSKLRNEIMNQRINNNNHADIISLKNINLERPVYILEACHIYEINQIKQVLLKNQDLGETNKLLNSCYDPNNGLMLPKEYHYYFDRGIIMFDSQGNAFFDEDYLEDLSICGIHEFKIKDEYFNKEMKNYLIKRYN